MTGRWLRCSTAQAEANNDVVVVAITASEYVLDAPAVGAESGEVGKAVGIGRGKGKELIASRSLVISGA